MVALAEANSVFAAQLEKLVLAVEQQQGSDHRARSSFLVLTQTLLLGLGKLSETQHLLTAQRVYMLLERPLLELIKNSSQVGNHICFFLLLFLLLLHHHTSILVAVEEL